MTAEQRFWKNVDKTDFCWNWKRHLDRDGYGTATIAKGIRMRAHRYSYILHAQKIIPDGMTIDHICRNRRCVNPLHLRLATMRENLLSSPFTMNSINIKKTSCIHGHEYTQENTYYAPDGTRACKQCGRENLRRSRANARTSARRLLQAQAESSAAK